MRQIDIFEFLDALDEYENKVNEDFNEAAEADKEEQVFEDVEEINEPMQEENLIKQVISNALYRCIDTNTLPTLEEVTVIEKLDLISRYYNE